MEYLLRNVSRRPDITFYSSGRIDITSALADRLGLEHDDVIDIAVDGLEYYIYILVHSAKGQYEGKCRSTKNGKRGPGRNFRAYSKTICRHITKDMERMTAIMGDDAVIDNQKAVTLIIRR